MEPMVQIASLVHSQQKVGVEVEATKMVLVLLVAQVVAVNRVVLVVLQIKHLNQE